MQDSKTQAETLYPSEDEIDKMVFEFVNTFTDKDRKVAKQKAKRRHLLFGYQEGLYRMLEIWKSKASTQVPVENQVPI